MIGSEHFSAQKAATAAGADSRSDSGNSIDTSARATAPRKTYALTGHSVALDPRVNPVRGDLADLRLVEYVFAPHYAAPVLCHAVRKAAILPLAKADAVPLSEILPGETFEMLELSKQHAWGMCVADGSVGFVDVDALERGPGEPSGADDRAGDGLPGDVAAAAAALIGTAWLDGGRSRDGVDAGGLVFLACKAAGLNVLRFPDLQAETLGVALPEDEALQSGDIIFFADHAAIMVDGQTAVHASRDAGAVIRTLLAEIIAAPANGPVIARRRPA